MTIVVGDNLVTFALLTFNQERYVVDAVRSALAQDYSPLQIVISDDASSDNTFLIIENAVAAYKGPHQITLNRNLVNLGVGDHLNLVAGIAKSNLIVWAAGDDISCPERVRLVAEEYLRSDTKYFYASSNAEIMDPDGCLTGKRVAQGDPPDNLWRLARGSAMPLGATSACTKGLFDLFGALHRHLVNEDFVLPLRAHLMGRVVYLPQVLVQYRVGAGSISQDDRGLSRSDLFAHRARYLARQQSAIANMLQDLCFFDSFNKKKDDSSKMLELKEILCGRLTSLAAVEAYNHYCSQGRRIKGLLQLCRVPGQLWSMVLTKYSRAFG